LSFRIVCAEIYEHADPPHPFRLLCARHQRPRRRAAESRDERAPVHSMTSSARASSDCGTSSPNAFVIFSDAKHRCFRHCIMHVVGECAYFLGPFAPVLG
jgi:hypothetical protein